MSFNIKNNVHWVGKIDWELKKFHGDEYSTHKGSSYNSYLITEDKTALIDTVWEPFSGEFISRLSETVDLKKIDYIIVNHGEVDHSGSLPELMRLIPETPIYCTANGVKSLKGQYHKEWNYKTVKTGDRLNLGSKDLVFVEAAMLHWPDTMFSYLTGDNILFSSDAFGHHYASELMYNDLVDQYELLHECIKYYANILTPFNKMVTKKIQDVTAMNLPLDIICPSHGVMWRKDPAQIIKKYMEWADSYKENQITVIYDSMWNGTRIMAENIVRGIREGDPGVVVKMLKISTGDKNDIITEVFKSKGLIVGSPTVNRGILSGVAGIMEEIKGLGFKGKKGGSFGTYGWSGESVKLLNGLLAESGFEVSDEGLRSQWNPDGDTAAKCFEYGKNFALKA